MTMIMPAGYVRKHPNAKARRGLRWCASCKSYRAISKFHFWLKGGTYSSYCDPCRLAKARAYRAKSKRAKFAARLIK